MSKKDNQLTHPRDLDTPDLDKKRQQGTAWRLRNPIPLPLKDLAPPPEIFAHPSRIHGQSHAARVVVYTFLLTDTLRLADRSSKAWAAAYIHDIGRKHDDACRKHGQYAMQRLALLPEVKVLLEKGGVTDEDWESISAAVEYHCVDDIPRTHPHWEMTAILKDADNLDRVRLGDLDPRFLRFKQSHGLIPFAEALYEETQWSISPGPDYFARLWPIAQRLIGNVSHA